MREENVLVGKTVTGIKLADNSEAIMFEVAGADPVIARCDADCCSYTWIEHVELPTEFPATVLSVEEIDLPGDSEDGELKVYGCKITTDKGVCIIDYRNESNGYYGGNLSWPGDGFFYGGVFGQNAHDTHTWVEIQEQNSEAP